MREAQERRGRRRRRGRLARLARATAACRRSRASTPARSSATSATAARCAAGSSPPSSSEAEARERVAAEPSMEGADLARTVTPGRAGRDRRATARTWSASTPGSSSRSSGSSASADCRVTLLPVHGVGRARCSTATPTSSSSPTGPATRRRSTTSSTPSASWSASGRWSGSASATSCSAARSGSRPSSCRSATAAPTTRSRTWRPGRIDITSQNHGFAVRGPGGEARIEGDEPVRWETDFGAAELSHLNLYDRTVEGLVLKDVPGAHGPVPPRGRPGPARRPLPLRPLPGAGRLMPRRDDIQKILLIGSGPIVIGQAAEFDYSGVQACKVLLEEGYEVVLVNSNPATIMTDPEFADRTYVEPLTPGLGGADHRARAPRRAAADARRPDGAQPRQGAARRRHAGALRRRADRRRLRGDPPRRGPRGVPRDDGGRGPAGPVVADRRPASATPSAALADGEIELPAIVRPGVHARRPGRRASGETETELRQVVSEGLAASPINQVLVEESVLGWGEFELEVMRDRNDNVVVICSIENVDPMGVHTGDSVTVAPAQTLTDRLYQELRDQALRVIRAVGVETGGSNIQFAVNPRDRRDRRDRDEPARLALARRSPRRRPASRSRRSPPSSRSATRSRRSPTTSPRRRRPRSSRRSTTWSPRCPRFAFEKFPGAEGRLSTHMKSVGEAMAIGRTFRESFAKAMRSRELDAAGRLPDDDRASCSTRLETPVAGPLRPVLEAFRRGVERRGGQRAHLDRPVVPARAASAGDRGRRHRGARRARFKSVDTCAAEFEARTPYYYSAHERPPARSGRGPARRPRLGRDPRRGAEPDRPGDRVRLLLRARGDDRARVRPRRGDGQLQPGDGLDRLRHLRPPLLRAADRRGRARGDRGRAPRGRDRPVRRPDAAASSRARSRRPACRLLGTPGRRDRPRRGPRPLRRAAAPARDRPPALRDRALGRGGGGDRRARSASRCWSGPPTCSAAGRWRSATRPRASPPTWRPNVKADQEHPLLLDRFLEDAIEVDVDALADGDGRPRRRDHAARRGGGRPLRRLGLRAPADEPRRGDARARSARRPRGSRSSSASSG